MGKWPDGLSSAIDALKPIMQESWQLAAEAQRRLWAATDEVERLRRLLTDAETVKEAAERDYEWLGKHMQLVWDDLRASVLKIPTSETAEERQAWIAEQKRLAAQPENPYDLLDSEQIDGLRS